MKHMRWLNWAVVFCVGVVALPAAAGESPLAQLPADTPVVVSVHGLQGTKERLAAMIKKALPDQGAAAVAKMDEALDKVLEGRKLDGLDPQGPIFVVLTSLPRAGGGQPPVAVVAKVTNYKTFRDGFLKEDERKNLKKEKAGYETTTIDGKEHFLIHRKGYVIVAGDKEVADQFLGKQGTGLDGKLSKQVAARLLESDVALYVDMAAINKEYGESLQGFRQIVPFLLDQAADNAQGQLDKTTVKFMKGFLEGFFQAVADSRHVLLSVSFRPEGLALHVGVGIGKDSSTNKFLKEAKLAPLTGLAALPSGFLGYTALELGPETLKALQPAMLGVLGSSEGAHEKALEKAMDQLVAAGPGPQLIAQGLGGKGFQVMHYADPAKAAAAQLKVCQALRDVKKFATIALKEKPVIRPNAETYRGAKFHYFSVKWDFEEQLKNLPAGAEKMAEAMKKLSGDGANIWFGPLDGTVVQVTARDWKAAEKLLGEYLDKKATVGDKHKHFNETRARLPEKTTLVSLISVPRAIAAVTEYAGVALQALGGAALPPLPPAKGPEPFLGVSVSLRSGHAALDVWVPGETAREVVRVVEAVKGALGQ
jgi:hypothetical protein